MNSKISTNVFEEAGITPETLIKLGLPQDSRSLSPMMVHYKMHKHIQYPLLSCTLLVLTTAKMDFAVTGPACCKTALIMSLMCAYPIMQQKTYIHQSIEGNTNHYTGTYHPNQGDQRRQTTGRY